MSLISEMINRIKNHSTIYKLRVRFRFWGMKRNKAKSLKGGHRYDLGMMV